MKRSFCFLLSLLTFVHVRAQVGYYIPAVAKPLEEATKSYGYVPDDRSIIRVFWPSGCVEISGKFAFLF